MTIYQLTPEHIHVESCGAVMEVNPKTEHVQVYGNHPSPSTVTYFNKVLRDCGIDKRIVMRPWIDNKLDVVPLSEVI